ncbi:MAG: type II toxin-antitoxin system Phd/YefM family antitoxin [Methylococcales bacterium]|nr:type II toxin-antitoxin system Phd/YefM family antitoxin [Methylococcales bacterium]
MKTISAKEAKNAFGNFLDAAQREPIMITKRDRPIGIFFSMHDIESLMQVGDSFKDDIKNGILAGVADAEAGRVKTFNQDYANDLKARVRAKLESNQNA